MTDNIHTICVCGAGTMGSGIAQVCASAGYHTILFDVNAEMLIKGRIGIEKGLQSLVDKQRLSADDRSAILSRIEYVNEIHRCIADVVIEAVVEKQEVKASLFNQLAEVNHSDVIFATNTSSLSIAALQEHVMGPHRVVGMHFFNPAPLMRLVEVVKGERTADAVVDAIVALTKRLGKTPVTCKDAPGFIVNRVARPYYLEAMRCVQLGITSVEDADAILEATGFKMGPFKLMDLIGMDVNFAVSNIVWDALGRPERLTPSSLQKEKVEQGKLGRKTGEGFYTY